MRYLSYFTLVSSSELHYGLETMASYERLHAAQPFPPSMENKIVTIKVLANLELYILYTLRFTPGKKYGITTPTPVQAVVFSQINKLHDI